MGSGDGLIAFGALDRVGPNGTVIVSDVSVDLVEQSRSFGDELGSGLQGPRVPVARSR